VALLYGNTDGSPVYCGINEQEGPERTADSCFHLYTEADGLYPQ